MCLGIWEYRVSFEYKEVSVVGDEAAQVTGGLVCLARKLDFILQSRQQEVTRSF